MILKPSPGRNVTIIGGIAKGKKNASIVKVKHPVDNIIVRYETGNRHKGQKLYGQASMEAKHLVYR